MLFALAAIMHSQVFYLEAKEDESCRKKIARVNIFNERGVAKETAVVIC